MRILVFGAGSLGCAIGGMLAQNHAVTLVGRRENMAVIRRDGLHLTGDVEATAVVNAVESVEGLDEPELMVLTTKAYNTRAAVETLESTGWADSPVITFQNGIGNLEVLRTWRGPRAFGGTTTIGASLLSPGNVLISGLGSTIVGADEDEDGASRIADVLAASGIRASTRADITSEIWAKAVVNACINPLTAVLGVPNGSLLESPTISRLMSDVCEECLAVAAAAGIRLPEGSAIDRVRMVAKDTAENRSSMLRDVESGRRTEIEQINGMICKVGMAYDAPAPLNRALTAMVRALEPLAP